MRSIDRHIVRTTSNAFLVVLVGLTLLMWLTQALRQIDLITNQRQSVFVFLGISALILPLLIMILAPFALMIAAAYVLNRFGEDAELIVMNASGMGPWQIFRPFLIVGLLTSLLVFAMSFYVSPLCLHALREWGTEIRADLLSTLVQPGRFVKFGDRLTFHVRERQPNGELRGVMLDDQRDPGERVTILAERGDVLKKNGATYLLMRNGSLQRQDLGKRDPEIVQFDRYAVNLSTLSNGAPDIRYNVQERYSSQLLHPTPAELASAHDRAAIWTEINNRVIAVLYPLAFVVLTFVYLGPPRTTREGRTVAILGLVAAAGLLRILGFLGVFGSVQTPALILVPYVSLAATALLGWYAIRRCVVLEAPRFVSNAIAVLMSGFAHRFQ
jgi:lipopolysaccharide export system permease protein